MAMFKLKLSRGQTSKNAIVAAGSAEAQSDTLSLNIHSTRMSRGEALILLGEMALAVYKGGWPPKVEDGTPPGPDLQPLSLSASALTVGDGSTAVSIGGTTQGSTLSATDFPVGMTFSSGARSLYGIPSVPGVYAFDIVEALGGATRTTRVSIEVRATLKFSQSLVSVGEGAAGATTVIELLFERSHAYKGALPIEWTFAAGTTSPDDYASGAYPVPAPIALASAALTGKIAIAIKGDGTVEPDEDFVAGLVAPAGYVLVAPAACTGRLLNDDVAGGEAPAIVLEANPPGETVGPFDSAGNRDLDTNSRKQQVTFSPTADGNLDCTFRMSYNPATQSWNQAFVRADAVFLKRFVNGQEASDPGGQLLPARPAAATDVFTIVQSESHLTVTQNGVTVHDTLFAPHEGGTMVGLRPWNQVRECTVGGQSTPLRILSSALNGDLTLTADVEYTGAPDTWQVQKRDSGGVLVDWTDVVLVTASKGKAQLKTRLPYPNAARGKGVSWLIRQRNEPARPMPPAQVLTIADPRMTFGVNLTAHIDWWGNVVFRDHICGWRLNGAYDADPQINRRGDPLEIARSVAPFTFILPPRRNGQRMRLRWKGVAAIKLEGNAGSSVRSPVNGSGGGYTWIDFNFDYEAIRQITGADRDGSNVSLFILDGGTGTGATWPSEWECYPINADGSPVSTGRFDPDFLADCDLYATKGGPSPFRTMDWQSATGYAERAFVAADLATAGERGPSGAVSIPDILEFHRLKGKRPRIHIYLSATEAYVRALARLCRDWGVAHQIAVLFELQNEIWNPGQGAWTHARLQGGAKWSTSADNDAAMRWHNFRFNQVMAWVREEFEAVPNARQYMVRVISGQCDSPGNRQSFCEGQPGDLRAIDECERIDVAPYCGGEKANGISTGSLAGDLAEYQRRILVHMVEQHANAKIWQQYAFANGKEFGCYEGGIENSSGNEPLVKAHRLSPLHGEAVTAILDHWQTNLGGFYSWYYNTNPIWGLKTHAIQPVAANADNFPIAYGFNAWKAKMDQVAA